MSERGRRAAALALALAAPLGLSLATLAFLAPSPLEGRGGVAWVARAVEAQPLLVGLALYFAFALVARHWLGRAGVSPQAVERGANRTSWVRFAAAFVALSAAAFAARATLVSVHRVVGASMAPTLNPGDRLFVDRRAYGLRLPFGGRVLGARLPQRGDVVVLANGGRVAGPGAAPALVKRVVGLPGDLVAYSEGSLVINGKAVPTCDAGPYLVVAGGVPVAGRLAVEVLDGRPHLTFRSPRDEARLESVRVAPGEVFVLGDDRVASEDSRAWSVAGRAGVPLGDVQGRVTRRALARLRDGRLDLLHPFAPVGLGLREPNVDLRQVEQRIAECVAHAPRAR